MLKEVQIKQKIRYF